MTVMGGATQLSREDATKYATEVKQLQSVLCRLHNDPCFPVVLKYSLTDAFDVLHDVRAVLDTTAFAPFPCKVPGHKGQLGQ